MQILGRKLDRTDPMLPQVISMEKKYCEGLSGAGDGMLLDMMPFLRHLGVKSFKILEEAVRIRKKLWGKYLPDIKVSTCLKFTVNLSCKLTVGCNYF